MQDEGLLDNFRGIGEYNIDLTASSTARYHCISSKEDSKHVVSSLKILAQLFFI